MSIKDIAERAGVSASTVSRVLNDPAHRCSGDGVRERIWKIAREMNYLPNEAARSLKTGAGPSGGHAPRYIDVLMTRSTRRQAEPFFAELLRVIEAETQRRRCIISNVWSLPTPVGSRRGRVGEPSLEGILGGGHTRSDGLIMLGKCSPATLDRLLVAYHGNVVCVGRNSVGQKADEVLCDGEQLARIAVEHLIGLGHSSIGYVGDCKNESRCRGYQRTLLDHGLEPEVGAMIPCEHTEAAGYAVMKQLVAEADDAPTAIFCATDAIAVGMLRCLGELGGRYYRPSIISCDDIEAAQLTTPALTTVALPKQEMGRYALWLLSDRMDGLHTAPTRMEVFGRLVVRASCSLPSDATAFNYVI